MNAGGICSAGILPAVAVAAALAAGLYFLKKSALQLLYFQYAFLLEIRTHRENCTKPAKNAGASKKPQKKEIPFCLWKILQAIENNRSLKRTKPFKPKLRTRHFDLTH